MCCRMKKASCRTSDLAEIYCFGVHGSASCVVQDVKCKQYTGQLVAVRLWQCGRLDELEIADTC